MNARVDELTPLPPDLRKWLARELALHGYNAGRFTARLAHHYPWSAVWQITPAAGGPLYIKACAESQRFEAALSLAIARWRPSATLPVIAIDVGRGWLLMPEAARNLRQLLDELPIEQAADLARRHWPAALVMMAETQLALAAHLPEMLGFGVPDQRLDRLPDLLADLLAHPERLVLEGPDALTVGELRRLESLMPRVQAACAALAGYGLPDTIDHGDFFDKHVLLEGGGYRLMDWGDAIITHPFLTLSAPVASIGARLEFTSLREPVIAPMVDAYLAPWQAFAPLPDLRDAAELATRLGALPRALNWVRAMGPHREILTPDMRELYASGVAYWLRSLESGL